MARTGRFGAGQLALALCLAAVAVLFLPLFAILLESLFARGAPSFVDLEATRSGALKPLFLSFAFAAGSAMLASSIASACAALVVWTNVAGRRVIVAIVMFPLFLPAMIYGFGWILLAAPNSGLINRLLGGPVVDIYSLTGMIWVEALHAVPVVFLLLSGVFRSVSAETVHAARLTGASGGKTVLRIVLPLVAPGLMAGFLLVFVRALGAFEIPAIIGISAGVELVSTHIYLTLRNSYEDVRVVSLLAGVVMTLAIALTYLGRSGLSSPAGPGLEAARDGSLRIDLGRWRFAAGVLVTAVLALLAGLPLCALLAKSLSGRTGAPDLANYARVLGDRALWDAGARSLVWAGAATLLLTVMAVALVWTATRMRSRIAERVVALSQVVFCLPGVIIGVGVLIFYGGLELFGQGAAVLILIVYALRGFPYALIYAQNALRPLSNEVWDSGRMSGASRLAMLRRVILPLAGPILLAGAVYILAISMREVSATVLLYRPGEEFLSVFLWQFWQDGELGRLAALSICLGTVTASLLLASYKTLAALPAL